MAARRSADQYTERPETGGALALCPARDYHEIIKGKLKELAGFLVARAGGDVKVFVDTAPVMEKPLAEDAAGWAGRARAPC
jgi:epoxyqueuosine reductase